MEVLIFKTVFLILRLISSTDAQRSNSDSVCELQAKQVEKRPFEGLLGVVKATQN